MKVDLYIDVYVGCKLEYLTATATPFKKSGGSRRYKITANIPDSAFFGDIDSVAPVDEIVEVDKEV